MAKQHYILPSGATPTVHPVRLGAGSGSSNHLTTKDEGKLIKLVAESRYDLCAAGDPIEGVIYAIEPGTSQDFTVGGRIRDGMVMAIADGLQATAGTGTLAVGDYVVAGTITAKGTALTSFPKVCKATVQPGVALVSTVATADTASAVKVQLDAILVTLAASQKNLAHNWRVVSLGTVGTGAVGTAIVIERV